MEPAMMSTASALTGTVVGGLTSVVSGWVTRFTQSRAERSTERRGKREELYSQFHDEVLRLMCLHGSAAPADLLAVHSLYARILLASRDDVIEKARRIVADLRRGDFGGEEGRHEIAARRLEDFIKACRREVRSLR